jgi:TetR/AcrR family transcriptional repressor of nem operon
MGIIARKGFNSTGIEAILKRAGVPKGSFYHYFSSKEEFGLCVLAEFSTGIDRIFSSFLTDTTVTPLVRLKNCTESLVHRFEENNCSIGCLAANLGQEMADQSEDFRCRLAEIFRSWLCHFGNCIRDGQDSGEISSEMSSDSIAEFFLSGFEGALLISKVMKTSDPLRNFMHVFFESFLRA